MLIIRRRCDCIQHTGGIRNRFDEIYPSTASKPLVKCFKKQKNDYSIGEPHMWIQTFWKNAMVDFVAFFVFNPRSEATAGKILSRAFEQTKRITFLFFNI